MLLGTRIGLLGLLGLALLPATLAAHDPGLDWRQIRTRHFVIIYPAEAGQAAAAEAAIAEAAYEKVARLCGYAPAGPIPLVLNSRQDQANGITYGFMPKIELYLAPPVGPWEGTLNAGWLEFVTTHELTHLCYGTRTAGFTRVLSNIFGEVNFWNFIAPQWWVEGVAEYGETVLTPGGRGRSPYHDMVLAANLLSDEPWSLGQASNFPETVYPFDRPYVAGVDLVQGLAEVTDDPAFLDKVSRQQSAWPFFGIGFAWKRSLKVRLGPLFDLVWRKRTRDFQERYGAPRPAMDGAQTVLTRPGARYSQPHWLDHATLAGYAATPDAAPAIVRLDLESGREVTLAEPSLLTGRLGFQSGTGRFIYSRLLPSAADPDALTADVFSWSAARGEERMTRQARGWSPNLSPDSRMVLVKNDLHTSHLAIMEPEGGWRDLPAPAGATFYAPCWSPDGQRLAAAVRINGRQDICLVDPASGTLTALTGWDAAGDFDPAWAPDSRSLYFVSDRTGVHQIYHYEFAGQSLRRITDSRMGAFDPAVSPDGSRLAFAEYRVGNYQDWVVAPLPSASGQTLAVTQEPMPQAPESLSLPAVRGEAYAPGGHLLPTFWVPNAIEDRQRLAVGVYTGRQDPLRWHAWSLQAYAEPESGATYGDLAYTFAALPVDFSVNLFSLPFFRAGKPGDLADQTLYWARRRGGTVSASLPLTLALRERGGTVLQLAAGTTHYQLLEGDRPVFPDSRFRSVHGSAVFASTNRTEKDYFPTAGFQMAAAAEAALGNDFFDGRLISGAAEGYWPGPEHTAAVIGLRMSQLAGSLPESVSLSVPRGYSGGVFNAGQTALFSAGYRIPLWEVDRGPGIVPIFLHGFWVELFGDWGAGWNGKLASPEDWYRQSAWSYGLQLHTDLEWFWSVTSSVGTTLAVKQDGGVYSNFGLQVGF